MRLKNLLDKRAKAWSEVQDIRERMEREDPALTEDEVSSFTRALDEVEDLSKQIETEERAAKMDAAMTADVRSFAPDAPDAPEDAEARAYADAFGAYIRGGNAELNAEQRSALNKGFSEFKGEERALAGGTGSTGGYLIPTETLRRMTETMKAFGGLLDVATVLRTSSGNTLQWPTVNDTGNVGALLADNTQISEQDAAFGQNDLGAFTYTSKLMRVPWNLLQDEVFNLEAFLARIAGQRIGRAVAPHLATGDGSGKPTGLIYAATIGVTTASPTAITFDELIDLEHSVDPAYRNSPTARFVFSDNSLKAVRKLKDGNNNYLWQPSVQAGVPSTILGRPYVIDLGIADIAATALVAGFGDVAAAFIVREVAGGTMVTLRERYADYLQNGYFAFQRYDSVLDDASAFKTLKMHA